MKNIYKKDKRQILNKMLKNLIVIAICIMQFSFVADNRNYQTECVTIETDLDSSVVVSEGSVAIVSPNATVKYTKIPQRPARSGLDQAFFS